MFGINKIDGLHAQRTRKSKWDLRPRRAGYGTYLFTVPYRTGTVPFRKLMGFNGYFLNLFGHIKTSRKAKACTGTVLYVYDIPVPYRYGTAWSGMKYGSVPYGVVPYVKVWYGRYGAVWILRPWGAIPMWFIGSKEGSGDWGICLIGQMGRVW
jgi:hypothetical protein